MTTTPITCEFLRVEENLQSFLFCASFQKKCLKHATGTFLIPQLVLYTCVYATYVCSLRKSAEIKVKYKHAPNLLNIFFSFSFFLHYNLKNISTKNNIFNVNDETFPIYETEIRYGMYAVQMKNFSSTFFFLFYTFRIVILLIHVCFVCLTMHKNSTH